MRIPALVFSNETICKETVRLEARRRAAYLAKQKAERIVFFRAELSLESIYWILGTWMSGRIVCPIHPGATTQEREQYAQTLGDATEIDPSNATLGEELSEDFGLPPLESVWAILFSSGSSGTPKAVALSGKNFYANAMAHSIHHGLTPKDCWLASLPFFHVGGFTTLTRAIFLGQELAVAGRFQAQEAAAWMASGKVAGMSLVPTMLWKILAENPAPESQLKVLLLGGAGVSRALLEKSLQAKLPVRVSYGLTESCSQLAAGAPNLSLENYAGKLLPGFSVLLSQEGEIFVRGEAVSAGYWRQGKITPIANEFGYFPTKDLGFLVDGNKLCVSGRKSDLIISGGENIFPKEVEDALLAHPEIMDAAVAGIPDPKWGETLVAALVVKTDTIQEVELLQFLRERLNPWKLPRKFLFVEKIPRNPMQKIIRQEVVKLFLS